MFFKKKKHQQKPPRQISREDAKDLTRTPDIIRIATPPIPLQRFGVAGLAMPRSAVGLF